MKKVIAWLLVLALTAAISIGATLAYLTDTDEDVNVMTLGKVKIDQLEYERIDVESKDDKAEVQEFHDNKPLIPAVTDKDFNYTPGDTYVDWEQIGKDGYTSDIWDPAKINNEVDKMVFVKNKGDYDAYVRSIFAFEAGKYTTLDQFKQMVHLNLNETDYTWEWLATPVTIGESTYFVAAATYNKVLAPSALTEISLSQIALDKTATNEDVEAFGDTYQILVKSQGIQADGFTDPDFALNDGFGAIDANTVPWTVDNPTKGIDLKTALHYLDGKSTGTQITKKVSNVTFGLTGDYAAVADKYSGVLVDQEQDVPVYAYYVPNGSNYDVYLLANDTIYTPKDSGELFYGMSAMKTLNTANLDTGRTESMYRMLRECSSLTTLDVSKWDTSNVVNMWDIFRQCTSLKSLDASDWDVSKVTNMYCAFYKCTALAELDVSTWDTGNVDDMAFMFRECPALTSLDVSDWDVSGAELLRYMFYKCTSLKELDVSNWDTSSATKLDWMFGSCISLTELDVSGWDTGNVDAMNNMFYGASQIQHLDISDWDVSKVTNFEAMFGSLTHNIGDMQFRELDISKWDLSSAVKMNFMFYGCGHLTEMDVSDKNMPNLTTVSHMFADCFKLERVDVSGWNTPALTSLNAMFNHCTSMKTVDVSSFDTAKVREFAQLFEACSSLETIVGLENFNTGSGQDFSEIFSGCSSLQELNLSTFDTRNADYAYLSEGQYENWMFLSFMSGCSGLKKVTFGPYFSFDGNGNCPGSYKFGMPAASAVEGWDGNWYDADGNAYAPSAIQEETAKTYYAVKPVNP